MIQEKDISVISARHLQGNINKFMMILCDPASERAVLAGICSYGEEAYLDIADIVQESTFTIDSNGTIFNALKESVNSNIGQR